MLSGRNVFNVTVRCTHLKAKELTAMHLTDHFSRFLFSRDMLLKTKCHSLEDIVTFDKITVQYTSKHLSAEKKNILPAFAAFQLLTGAKPRITRAKKSLASYQLREGSLTGLMVTLRREKIHTFLDTLVNVHLPRIQRYEEIYSSAVQKHVHFGIEELLFFPVLEGAVELFEVLPGCSVHVHTKARTQAEKLLICSAFKLPVALFDLP
jgi:large subunit ribosomal protein L5